MSDSNNSDLYQQKVVKITIEPNKISQGVAIIIALLLVVFLIASGYTMLHVALCLLTL